MRFPCRVLLLAPGPVRYGFVLEGVKYFSSLINRFVSFEYEFPRVKVRGGNRKEAEASVLKRHIPADSYLVILDEHGKTFSSRSLAKRFEDIFVNYRTVTLVVGGPEGLHESLFDLAQLKLSLSPLTLNHEIVLLLVCEVLYRTLTIISSHPYHRD